MNDILILKNGDEIKLETGTSLSDIRVLFETKQEMLSTWDKLTKENLEEVLIKNSDGLIVGRYYNLVLENETSTMQEDGAIITSFRLREKTEIEKLKEEIAKFKEGQNVQDGAIADLGEAVSGLAEGGGIN